MMSEQGAFRVLWHTTMSLDGFIAAPDGGLEWAMPYAGPNPVMDDVIPRIGAVLMGARTYSPPVDDGDSVYGGAWAGPQFVLTHAPPDTAAPGFTFLSGDIGEAVATARSAAGSGYLVILGAATARLVLEAGLMDEILIHMVPVLLGDGVRLYEHPGGMPCHLEVLSVTQTGAVTNLWYRVNHS